jgi:predicted metal-binding membrane protein
VTIANLRRSAVAPAMTLGLAGAAWCVALKEMSGVDMGATQLNSLASFIALWVPMMAAMMLPGATPTVFGRASRCYSMSAAPLFVASYLAVWTFVGLAVYALYRPHGSLQIGAAVIVAGLYEFTPVKQHFRRLCRENGHSGFAFGLHCVGSCIGLMLMQGALGLMSVSWMLAISVVVFAQKLLPPKAVIDVPPALALVGFGILIIFAPSTVLGSVPALCGAPHAKFL